MAVTKEQARAAVLAEINQPALPDPFPNYPPPMPEPVECVIIDEYTIEKEWGWVFYYNSREFSETRDPMMGLVGNAPYIVNRHDGSLHATGTARSIEYYIEAYERELAGVDPKERD